MTNIVTIHCCTNTANNKIVVVWFWVHFLIIIKEKRRGKKNHLEIRVQLLTYFCWKRVAYERHISAPLPTFTRVPRISVPIATDVCKHDGVFWNKKTMNNVLVSFDDKQKPNRWRRHSFGRCVRDWSCTLQEQFLWIQPTLWDRSIFGVLDGRSI